MLCRRNAAPWKLPITHQQSLTPLGFGTGCVLHLRWAAVGPCLCLLFYTLSTTQHDFTVSKSLDVV